MHIYFVTKSVTSSEKLKVSLAFVKIYYFLVDMRFMTSSSGAKINALKNTCFSLGIISIKDINDLVKININFFNISKIINN